MNGEPRLTGSSDMVLGHPLANALPEHGLALQAGDYVTTSITTDQIYHASAGETKSGFKRIGFS